MKLPPSEWFNDPEYWEANRSFIWSKERIEMSEAAAAGIAKLLDMEPGESILDLACGFGRHSLALSKQGYSVTGIDLNAGFIQEASRKSLDMKLDARFLCADMRDFVEPDSFENIIIMYNSFGYFQNPLDDRKVLENCFQSLKPGGKLLLQDVTRECIIAYRSSRCSRDWHEESDGTIRLEETTANDNWTWNTTRWIVLKGSERREYTYGMRIYGTSEYCDLVTSVGFSNLQTYGGISGKPYDKEKHHLTLLAQKPNGNK
ncbi:MAG: methyltransferase domain-containing protein [Candidatus Aegiribacteria sp.]|nr:methyltransferase domain-containing protein [Candidatus Aegiribacteria sp.]